jgi:ParB-like chromosome segregation protein Spo0J
MTAPITKAPALVPDYSNLSPHPLSEIFPPMEVEGLARLAADIKATRLKEPIWLHEGKILDGNNRYRACLKLYYPFKDTDFRQFDPATQGDPLAFVVSANLHRRHLNESQRAAIAARLVTSKLGSNRYNMPSVTNEQAAKLLGVSEATVKIAKAVVDKAAPEIMEKVQKGEVRLGAVSQIIKKPKEEQVAELSRIKAEAEAEKKRKAGAAAAAKASQTGKGKSPTEAEKRQAALDAFSAQWSNLDDPQRRAFVMNHEVELAELLSNIRDARTFTGGGMVETVGS